MRVRAFARHEIDQSLRIARNVFGDDDRRLPSDKWHKDVPQRVDEIRRRLLDVDLVGELLTDVPIQAIDDRAVGAHHALRLPGRAGRVKNVHKMIGHRRIRR